MNFKPTLTRIESVNNIANMLTDADSVIDETTGNIIITLWNSDYELPSYQIDSCECHLKETLAQAKQEAEDMINFWKSIQQKIEVLTLIRGVEDFNNEEE